MQSWRLCRFMDVFTVFMHYPLKIQGLFHWDMRKRMGWRCMGKDTTCWIQDFSSWNFLQNYFPPWNNTTCSLPSLNLMKGPVGSSVFTWHYKSRKAADVTTASQWQDMHSEQTMDQALNRARNQHRPHWNATRSGKTNYFIIVMVLFWKNRFNYLRGPFQP